MVIILFILALMSTITFVLYSLDKRRAYYQLIRIPEWVLIVFTVLYGAFGALCAMVFFDHKTKKPFFTIGVPVLLAVQIGIYIILCWSGSIDFPW